MKNKYILLVLLVLVIGLFFFFMKKQNASGSSFKVLGSDAIVVMGSDSYNPQNFEVKKGTKVTFLNSSDGLSWPASDLHPSHLIYSAFDPKAPVNKGESWTFTFDETGEWGYHDHLAPYITGTILVTE